MSEGELLTRLEALEAPRVLIVGDLILDRYVSGEVSRISPEAPIPVLAARSTDERLGGAGNVAANLRSVEAEVELVGVVGDDALGTGLLGLLEKIGVEVSGCVRDATRPTTEKTRMVSGVQQLMRVDWERASDVGDAVADRLLDGMPERVARAGAVVLSDYGKGALPPRVISGVIAAARAAGVPCLVDPKGTDYSRYRGATLVTPNRKEAEEALGRKIASLDELPAAGLELMEAADLAATLITLGAEGIFHMERTGAWGRIPTVARQVFDVTGAGDTVIALLALGFAGGLELAQAVGLANAAAGIVVGRRGAASVTRAELRVALGERLERRGKVIRAEAELDAQLQEWRNEGKRIVFTNGCFDILHAGHVKYLQFARSKGDVLLVGVNSDESVRRLKGPSRPVNQSDDRMVVLAAMEMVDAVVQFEDDTPLEVIERVTPDVLVKGEDWAEKGVVGREWVEDHGGQVCLAPLLQGRSTTGILERASSLRKGEQARSG